ncbi:unnamed protein product [Ambrosiozyma monospora]|uniref:Unnamed protein product n=1 Tax=Ambrosiozyma monospora TaxID=43982 RepID=A0ACB5SWG6_AMBMO|nr:unnamed protein product [Ambrosiozyma monospora]
MADIFDFDEDELSSKVKSHLSVGIARSATTNSFSEMADKLGDLNEQQQPVQTFQKHRSNSVISVGSIDNRLGTSYKVDLDEIYDADLTESHENSSVNLLSQEASSKTQTGRKPFRKVVIQDFEPITVLGKGSYGKVILVKDKRNGKLYAQKQLKKAAMVVNASNYERTLTERF